MPRIGRLIAAGTLAAAVVVGGDPAVLADGPAEDRATGSTYAIGPWRCVATAVPAQDPCDLTAPSDGAGGGGAGAGADRPPSAYVRPPGHPREDDPGFDCRLHGNRTCGPGAAHAAGCYVAGALVDPWRPEMYGRWHNCGPVTDRDRAAMARLGETQQ